LKAPRFSGASCPFDECDGSGFVVDDATRAASTCRCRPQRIAAAKARKLSAVIPRRYAGVSFDRPPVTQIDPRVVSAVRRYVDDLDANLDRGQGLWLEGDVGTGKTTLAMLVSRSALERGRSVAIYSLPRLLSELRKTFDDGAEMAYLDLIDSLTAVDLLHVDDVGAERSNPWVLEQLYTIVNARYEEQRAVVITTNLGHDALQEQIGDRTVSRLVEMCGDLKLPLFGGDRRLEHEVPEPVVTPSPPWETGAVRYGEPPARRAG